MEEGPLLGVVCAFAGEAEVDCFGVEAAETEGVAAGARGGERVMMGFPRVFGGGAAASAEDLEAGGCVRGEDDCVEGRLRGGLGLEVEVELLAEFWFCVGEVRWEGSAAAAGAGSAEEARLSVHGSLPRVADGELRGVGAIVA